VTLRPTSESSREEAMPGSGRGGLREFLFRARSYTPLPLIVFILALAEPNALSFAIGLPIAAAGEALRIWGVSYAGPATRTRRVGAKILVTDGPYAYLRNPLYLGNFLISLGLCIASWAWMPWMIVVLTAAFAIQYGMIISLEEEKLRELFGERYERYASQVPRVMPRLSPYRERSQVVPDLHRALMSERSTFGSISAVLVLLILRWYLGRNS